MYLHTFTVQTMSKKTFCAQFITCGSWSNLSTQHLELDYPHLLATWAIVPLIKPASDLFRVLINQYPLQTRQKWKNENLSIVRKKTSCYKECKFNFKAESLCISNFFFRTSSSKQNCGHRIISNLYIFYTLPIYC